MNKVMFQPGSSVLIIGALNDFLIKVMGIVKNTPRTNVSADSFDTLNIEKVSSFDYLLLDLDAFHDIRDYLEDELVAPRQTTLCLLTEEQEHAPKATDFGDVIPCRLSGDCIVVIQ